MPHRFTVNGAIAKSFDRKTRNFFESRLVQTCSRVSPPLPQALERRLRLISSELVYYRDQVLNIIELQQALIVGRPSDTSFISAVVLTQLLFLTSLDHPSLRPEIELMAPSFLNWYRWFGNHKLLLTKSVKARIDDYRKSRSIFEHTPAEAAWLYKAHTNKPPTPPRPADGAVQIEFYRSFDNGKYGANNSQEPDFVTNVHVHPTWGVDLRSVRAKLGVESIAIITDKGPFRPTFEVANEDWLSPIGALDLTKQFTKPIRIYEPRVAQVTKAKRVIREPVYLAVIFISTFSKLLIGSPERDTAYLGTLYGAPYAGFYVSAGRVTASVQKRAREGVHLTLRALFTLCAVSLMALYATLYCGVHIAHAGVRAAYGASRTVAAAAVPAIAQGSRTALGLGMKTWLISIAICWFVAADIYSCTR